MNTARKTLRGTPAIGLGILTVAILVLAILIIRPSALFGAFGVQDSSPGVVGTVAADMNVTGNPTGNGQGQFIPSVETSGAALPAVPIIPETGAECTGGNNTDNETGGVTVTDGFVNDGCPATGLPELDAPCANGTDDDADGFVNDGCPGSSPNEVNQCTAAADNDADGTANDGCPQVGGAPEAGAACAPGNTADEDTDTYVNDGCPAVVAAEITQCADSIDDDSDGQINDGCAVFGTTEATPNQCLNNTDNDSDGFINDGCPARAKAESGAQCTGAGIGVDNDTDGSADDGCPFLFDVVVDEIDPADMLGSFSFDLKYDPAVVRVFSKSFASFMLTGGFEVAAAPIPDSSADWRIDVGAIGSTAEGEGVLIRVGLQCLTDGVSVVNLDNDIGAHDFRILNGASSIIPVTTVQDGSITCGNPPLSPGQLDVSKAYTLGNNGPGAVTVEVTCTDGAVATPISGDDQASPGDPAHFSITRPVASLTCSAAETLASVPAGYQIASSNCANLTINSTTPVPCTITNEAKATFTVSKDFLPNSGQTANILLACTSGTVTPSTTQPVTEAGPAAVFTVTGFASGATCTAGEPSPPAGYTGFGAGCALLPITPGGNQSCTYINATQAFLHVAKTEIGGTIGGDVTINVVCTSGTVQPGDPTATPGGDTADFTIEQFNPGSSCTVTENAVPGFEFSPGDCPTVTLNNGDDDTCTVTNTQTSTMFDVNKDYSDNNTGTVTVTVTCNDPDVVINPNAGNPAIGVDTSSEAARASFTLTGDFVPASTSCTATEPDAAGYVEDQSDCLSQPLTTPQCTLVNNAQGTITITKDYQPDNTDVVGFLLACNDGTTIDNPNPRNALEGTPAVFLVTNFTATTLCSVTESSVLAGYSQTSGCTNLDPVAGADVPCTVINEPSETTFTVTKNFNPPGSATTTNLTISCPGSTGTITPPLIKQITASGQQVSWDIDAFTAGDTCSVSEDLTGVYESVGCQNIVLADPVTACIMTNTTVVNIQVTKDWSPANPNVSATVSISCPGTGTVTPPTTGPISESPQVNADFVLRGFTAGDSCTVTETPVPAGYSASYSANCSGVSLTYVLVGFACNVTNTLNTTTLEVTKVENNGAGGVTVTINLVCPGAISVTNPDTSAASDGGDPANFDLSGFSPGTLTSNGCTHDEGNIGGQGYTAASTTCASVTLVIGGTTSCTITNEYNTQIVRVSKDFIPNDPQGVTILPNCPGSLGIQANTVTSTDNIATDTAPPPNGDYVEYTITGFALGQQCSFTESTPTGVWSADQTDCANKTLVHGGPVITCTITNSASITFLVKKNWDPDNGSTPVSVTLSCPGATVTPAGAQNAVEGTPASFTVNNFTVTPTCTATESPIPTGYFASGSPAGSCQVVATAGECTITNTLRVVTFTTGTDFTDDSETSPVTWVFTCTSGTKTSEDATSTETDDAEATFSGVIPPIHCDADATAPAGYHLPGLVGCDFDTSGDQASYAFNCSTVVVAPNDTKFTVDKNFTNDSTSETVNITLTCTGPTAKVISTTSFGGAPDNTDDADELINAEFYVRYAAPTDTCSADETTVLTGLTTDESQCQNKAMVHGSDVTCVITNADITEFKVRKQFDPIDGKQVMITLTCNVGATVTVLDPTAGVFDPADFLIQGGTLCTATEKVPAGFTANQLDCAGFNQSKGECTILNRKGTTFPTFSPAPSGSPQPPTASPPPPSTDAPRPTRTPKPHAAGSLSGVSALSGVF